MSLSTCNWVISVFYLFYLIQEAATGRGRCPLSSPFLAPFSRSHNAFTFAHVRFAIFVLNVSAPERGNKGKGFLPPLPSPPTLSISLPRAAVFQYEKEKHQPCRLRLGRVEFLFVCLFPPLPPANATENKRHIAYNKPVFINIFDNSQRLWYRRPDICSLQENKTTFSKSKGHKAETWEKS